MGAAGFIRAMIYGEDVSKAKLGWDDSLALHLFIFSVFNRCTRLEYSSPKNVKRKGKYCKDRTRDPRGKVYWSRK